MRSDGARLTVLPVVDVANEQGTVDELRRHGAVRLKSVVRLMVRLLLVTKDVVSIVMPSWSLAETRLLDGVTEMMRWPCTIITSRPINIIILLQTGMKNAP